MGNDSIVSTKRVIVILALVLPAVLLLLPMSAAAIALGPDFAADYTFIDLGTPPALASGGPFPTPLGGVNLDPNNSNFLLLGGAANSTSGAIYRVGVTRDGDNHITGFSGSPTLYSTATNIDGGLSFGPGGVLFFTGFSNNILGQIKPSSTVPDKITDLSPLGISSSVGALAFVPNGFAGAGSFKIVSYNGGNWYDVQIAPDGSGTFNVVSATLRTSFAATDPEGIVYIDSANAGFDDDSILLAEYNSGRISAYEIDGSGDPIVSTRRDFITGLSGAEGAFIDPLTGDFIFSTFGSGNQVIVVQGFVVPPSDDGPTDDGPTDDTPPTGVPGPATLLLVGLGMAGALLRRGTRD
jgi:hypothetical protein